MRTLQTLLALVGGLALGAGATVGTVMLVNRHRTGNPTLILGKENLNGTHKVVQNSSSQTSDSNCLSSNPSGITCIQGLDLEETYMCNLSKHFIEECGNAKDLAPEILSARCKDVIKQNDKALEKFDPLSNLKELMPTLCCMCFNDLEGSTVKQNINGELRVLSPKDILELDSSDISSMSDIHISYILSFQGEDESCRLIESSGERRLLSNSEKAVAIRYLQAKFINKVINL